MKLFKRSKKTGSPFYVRYWAKLADGTAKQVWKSTGTPELATAKKLAAKILSDAALRLHGVIDDNQDRLRTAKNSTIEDSLKLFKTNLETRYSGPKGRVNVVGQLNYISSFTKFTGIKTIGSISADALNRYIVQLQEGGKAPRTISAMIGANKHFTSWLRKHGKLKSDPLETIQRPDPESDRKLNRRMLLPNEWNWLVAGAISVGESYGMSSQERILVYRTAIQTGLRANEIRSLSLGSFVLDGKTPYIKVEGGSTKNRQVAYQYIDADLADELRNFLTRHDPGEVVFQLPKKEAAKMIQADLAESRKLWLAASDQNEDRSDFLNLQNHAGEKLDFHSLRHTCGAWLALRDVQSKIIQTVMRHSTITLTMDTYGHILDGSQAEAVSGFGDLTKEPATQVLPKSLENPQSDQKDQKKGTNQESNRSDRAEAMNLKGFAEPFSRSLAENGENGVDYAGELEDSRMVRNLIRNQAPGNRLRVRIPCPPLI